MEGLSPKSPTQLTIQASAKDFEYISAQISQATPGSRVHVRFGNKQLEIVACGARTAVDAGAAQPGTSSGGGQTGGKRKGGKPQDAHFNKLALSLHEHYKTLKEKYCKERAGKMGVKPDDILVGNRTTTFSKFWKGYISAEPARVAARVAYYSNNPLPKKFDEEAEAWLWGYWKKAETVRQPRDRVAERAALKLSKLGGQGGSTMSVG